MATFVLIPGAGGDSGYWRLVAPELRARGHDVVAPDLPCADDSAGLAEYADVVVDAIGDRRDLVLVAQSMAGFTAPMVCERVPVDLLVLLNAMVPMAGESPGEWWANTGHVFPEPFDVMTAFLHDVPRDLVAELMAEGEHPQSDTPFEKPWPLAAWPDVPTRVLVCGQDRFFPAEFQHRVARERLGITPDEMDGGHLPALSRPIEVVERLEGYLSTLG